jgi:transcriptional regulator with XRE-family HTH domain
MAQSLRKIREHAGLSIEQLAAKTDVDAATLAGYERGDGVSELRLDRAIRISGACGVRLEIAPFT